MDKRRFFFFNDTATTEIYTLSLHDALPILEEDALPCEVIPLTGDVPDPALVRARHAALPFTARAAGSRKDRKSTRLNSSHANISYAVFCLKKKKTPLTVIIILLNLLPSLIP